MKVAAKMMKTPTTPQPTPASGSGLRVDAVTKRLRLARKGRLKKEY